MGNLLGVEPEPAHVFQAEIDALLSVSASPAHPGKETVSVELDDVEVNILELLSQLTSAEAVDARSLAPRVDSRSREQCSTSSAWLRANSRGRCSV